MSSELIASWITAIATAATAFAVFFVERSRRKYERKQVHFKAIKECVISYLNGVLIDHYLKILEDHDGILRFDTAPIISKMASSAKDPFLGWKPTLVIKSAGPSTGATVGDYEIWQKHQGTYPHLYSDAKEKHFPDLLGRWETFEKRFEELGRQSISLGEQLAQKIEEKIKLPRWDGTTRPGRWANYWNLSNYIYRRLWGAQTGTLNMNEQSGHWILQEWNETYCEGTKEEMECCRTVIDWLLTSENESVQQLREHAQHLLPEANEIKRELQQLLLKTDLPGSCKFS